MWIMSFFHVVMSDYVQVTRYITNGLSMLPEISTLFFPPAWSIHIQDAYINEKHLESVLSYKHGTSEAEQE